jgi:hypothetical protein
VPPVALADADAERIFAAAPLGEDPPALRFSADEYGCAQHSASCARAHERALLARAGSGARRDGARLTIVPAAGAPLTFVDWKQPATKTADGDSETHWYLGPMAGSGYLRVEVEFGHDAPGEFLVDPQSGKSAFVHNGADLAAPAPGGRLLVTWNALNPPLSLRVAALDAAGPRLVAQCAAPEGAARLTPVFKGWRDAHAFDFVIEVGDQGKSMVRVALSLGERQDGWRLGASDVARVEHLGFACRGEPGGGGG